MKISNIKFMSNYDKACNLMKIMSDYSAIQSKMPQKTLTSAPIQKNVSGNYFNNLINYFSKKFSK